MRITTAVTKMLASGHVPQIVELLKELDRTVAGHAPKEGKDITTNCHTQIKRNSETGGYLDDAGEQVVRPLKDTITGMKPRGTMNNNMRPGYRLLLKVINMAGVQARKVCGIGRLQHNSDASTRRRRKDALAEELVNLIKQFFLRDAISHQLPEKNLHGSEKRRKNRTVCCVVRYTLEEAHQKFLQECLFKRLASACQSCCNVFLKAEALLNFCQQNTIQFSVETSKTKLSNETLCEYGGIFPNPGCVHRTCEECGTEKYINTIPEAVDVESPIEFLRWGRKKLEEKKTDKVVTGEKHEVSRRISEQI